MTAGYGLEDSSGWALGENVERYGSSIVRAWWNIGRGRSVVGSSYKGKTRVLVGKGDRTFFGKDLWMGGETFKGSVS